MSRLRNTLGPIIGYHGCDLDVAEKVLSGQEPLVPSNNDYDWLGPGIYFWADSKERGLHWATEQSKRVNSKIKTPAVIGAFIHPGLCLNLTDFGVNAELLYAYDFLKDSHQATQTPLPDNTTVRDGVFLHRKLDCATIRALHKLREDLHSKPPYETVYGVFEEGKELFENSGFKEKTHIQIAVRNTECIIGYFRVT